MGEYPAYVKVMDDLLDDLEEALAAYACDTYGDSATVMGVDIDSLCGLLHRFLMDGMLLLMYYARFLFFCS